MEEPTPEQREQHLRFLRTHWIPIAVAAYQGFVEHGRGFLMLLESDIKGFRPGAVVKFNVSFLGEKEAMRLNPEKPWPGDKEATWVKEYDPDVTVLIGILRDDNGISSYRVLGQYAGLPKTLYDASRYRERNSGLKGICH